jgi:hypothetical protein
VAVKPILQALLLADHVYTDKETGKEIITGVFHKVQYLSVEALKQAGNRLPKLPGYRTGSPTAYISLTDVRGKQEFDLRYVDLSSDKPVFEVRFELQCQNPLETVEMVIPLPPLPSGNAGTFALELVWGDEPLGSHRVLVEEIQIPMGEEDVDND